jgi:hypothetical protein
VGTPLRAVIQCSAILAAPSSAVRRDQQAAGNATLEEKAFFDELAQWLREETGYQWIQGTRPQTLAFGLTDSPAGLAAWIVEKFRAWSDCAGHVENSFTRDRLLANISLYWFTGAIGSSFWPYYARMQRCTRNECPVFRLCDRIPLKPKTDLQDD